MSFFRHLRRGFAAIANPQRADADVDDEVRFYTEQRERELVAGGMSPAAAHRAATLEIGPATTVREHVRSAGWEHTVETAVADVRFALRRLRHQPAFTAIATLTLALSIGATTAIFSAINPILLRPLPYPGADRIISIDDRRSDGSAADATYGTFAEIAARARSLSTLAVTDNWTPSITGTAEPERLQGRRVSAGFLHVLGVAPAIGRDFDVAEDQVGAPLVAILSHRLVQRRFAGDAAIVGKTITLDGDLYQVIGVMPADFIDATAPTTDIWSPLRAVQHAGFNSREWGHHYHIFGRLAPNATFAQCASEMAAIAQSPMAAFSRPDWADLSDGLVVRSLQRMITADARPALLAIFGAVLVLLAIACVNVTNLLLARSAQRRGEFAMRSALGAGRGRILRQCLTESVILAGVGGALGLFVAQLGVRSIVALSPPGLPRIEAIRMDGWVLLFAFVVTAIVGLVVGVVPAIAASRASLHDTLQGASRRSAGGRTAIRSALVVVEVSLALVLLVSAGLLVRSLDRLFGVAPGFDPSHVLSVQVIESGYNYQSDSARARFFTQALDAVRNVPGVVDAAFTSQLPLSGDLDGYGAEFQAFPNTKPGEAASTGALRYAVTPDYFRTMRIPLRQGRLFDASDRMGGPEVMLISEALARQRFGTMSPIGQHVHFGPEVGSTRPWATIVGVVGDVKQATLGDDATAAFYVPMGQWWWVDNIQSLVVRTSGDPAALTTAVERAIHSVDPTLPLARVATMDRIVSLTGASRRFASIIFQSFALTALLLAAIGLYGVISGGVAERTREIGIRTALGQTSGSIIAGVVGNGLLLTSVGIVFGIGGAFVASRMLETMLFGVTRGDPITYLGVIALLAGVAVLACWSPARRAASVDPAITLRAE
jgi:putative ABC transport system permease protein